MAPAFSTPLNEFPPDPVHHNGLRRIADEEIDGEPWQVYWYPNGTRIKIHVPPGAKCPDAAVLCRVRGGDPVSILPKCIYMRDDGQLDRVHPPRAGTYIEWGWLNPAPYSNRVVYPE